MPQGKTQYTVVGQTQSDPDDPENPYRTAEWNTEGDVTKLRDLYKVSSDPYCIHFHAST